MITQPSNELQENILALANPESYEGRVWIYETGHSVLRLRFLTREYQHEFFLEFAQVEYFSGAIFWTGANFRIHPPKEAVLLYKQERPVSNHWLEKMEANDLIDHFSLKLYSISTTEGNLIRIIAAGFYLTDDVHDVHWQTKP